MLPLKLTVLLVFVMFLSETVSLKRYRTFAGPFKVDVKRAELCPEKPVGPHAATGFLEVRKQYHKPTLYGGNISIPFDADDSSVFTCNLASWSSMGGWKPNAYQATVKKPCTIAFRHFRPHVEYGMNIIFGEVIPCPFMAGIYRAHNVSIPENLTKSSSITLTNQFIYGKWRVDGRLFMKSGEMVACARGYVDTVPI